MKGGRGCRRLVARRALLEWSPVLLLLLPTLCSIVRGECCCYFCFSQQRAAGECACVKTAAAAPRPTCGIHTSISSTLSATFFFLSRETRLNLLTHEGPSPPKTEHGVRYSYGMEFRFVADFQKQPLFLPQLKSPFMFPRGRARVELAWRRG